MILGLGAIHRQYLGLLGSPVDDLGFLGSPTGDTWVFRSFVGNIWGVLGHLLMIWVSLDPSLAIFGFSRSPVDDFGFFGGSPTGDTWVFWVSHVLFQRVLSHSLAILEFLGVTL